MDDKDGTGMWSVNTRLTGYRVQGITSCKLMGQRAKGELERNRTSVVKVEMKRLGLVKEDAHNRDKSRSLTTGNRPTPTFFCCNRVNCLFSEGSK